MLTDDDREWLSELLHQKFENRISTIERELVEYRKTALTSEQSDKLVEQAQRTYRADTLRINMWTRISVAIIAALAVIGNGIANVLVDHTESKAMARYEHVTDQKLAGYESRIAANNRQVTDDVRDIIFERNSHLEALIVKAGNK